MSHTLSLSLRLYGNIGAEVLVAALAAQAAPYGLPLVIDALGLIPAVVQPIVFTLLTASFLATAVHAQGSAAEDRGAPAHASSLPTPAATTGEGPMKEILLVSHPDPDARTHGHRRGAGHAEDL